MEGDIFYVNGAISRRLSQHPELMAQYLTELERLLNEYWDEETLHSTIDKYVKLVNLVEPSTEEYTEQINIFKAWIDSRRPTIESYVASGGVEGAPGTMDCFGNEDATEFNQIGDLVAAASHSCTHASSPIQTLWLMTVSLAFVHRRKQRYV